MGGSPSKETILEKYGSLLESKEKEYINTCFNDIAGSRDAVYVTKSQLVRYVNSRGIESSSDTATSVCHALSVACTAEARAVSKGDANVARGDIPFAAYVDNLNNIIKGAVSNLAQFMIMCLTVHECSVEQLQLLVEDMLHSLLHSNNSARFLPHSNHWFSTAVSEKQLVAHLMASLLTDTGGILSHDRMEVWLTNSPLAVKIILLYMTHVFMSTVDSYCFTTVLDTPTSLLLPLRVIHPLINVKFSSQLLTQSSIILLNSSFPYDAKGQMVPLFSTRDHGESFSTLCKHIINKGPTLIVVRDNDGHVFGGFCNDSWSFNPQFTGSSECFLFSLHPNIAIYTASGYNNNFMYLQQNAQTLPNGLGMGGQLDYFGLWLSGDYGRGHSKAHPLCSTYNSPCLSQQEEFTIDLVEVWGVGPPLLPDEEGREHSILDKDKIAHALLEMAGKPLHSDGLREEHDIDQD